MVRAFFMGCVPVCGLAFSHFVALNFYPNECTKRVILKQVQDDGGWRGRACYPLATRNDIIAPPRKNNFPTNNQIGYLIRVMQAAV